MTAAERVRQSSKLLMISGVMTMGSPECLNVVNLLRATDVSERFPKLLRIDVAAVYFFTTRLSELSLADMKMKDEFSDFVTAMRVRTG